MSHNQAIKYVLVGIMDIYQLCALLPGDLNLHGTLTSVSSSPPPLQADIWNLGTPKFIYEFMKHMNSYLKKSYEFIVYMNSYMNSYMTRVNS